MTDLTESVLRKISLDEVVDPVLDSELGDFSGAGELPGFVGGEDDPENFNVRFMPSNNVVS